MKRRLDLIAALTIFPHLQGPMRGTYYNPHVGFEPAATEAAKCLSDSSSRRHSSYSDEMIPGRVEAATLIRKSRLSPVLQNK
jgi:hypothetical protein